MKVVTSSGKRKSAIARAVIKPGKGIVKINNRLLDFYEPNLSRLKLKEPLLLAADLVNKIDIKVNVVGGGISSQADASRLAIAKALVEY
jgi:small subunit ribosomal protein S9